MKVISKKYIFLAATLLSIIGLIVVNIFGVYEVFVLGEPYNVLEFIFGFFITLVFLLIGVAFLNYEGRGTPTNMLINGLFYVFLIAAIVFFVLFLREILNQKNNEVKKGL